MSSPRAYLLPCGTRYRHERGGWSTEEPISRLGHWIAAYRRLAERRHPRTGKTFHAVYGPDCTALEALKVEIE